MIKKTISYIDYNGDNQTEEHYFNLTKAELMRLRVKNDGKYLDHVQDLVAERKVEGLFDFFYNLLLDAHGVKSEDGKHFVKNPAERAGFESSIAFSEILAEFLGEPGKMSEFTRAILPPDYQDRVTFAEGEVILDGSPAIPPVG